MQDQFGVRFVTYWFEEDAGSGFCLIEGPDAESRRGSPSRRPTGLFRSTVIEVDQASVRGFFGRLNTHPPGEPYVDSAFRAILFTDIVDSTRITQQFGDRLRCGFFASTIDRAHRRSRSFGGNEVKHTGDGIMAAFVSAFQAVGAATEIQRGMDEGDSTEQEAMQVRIGVAAGNR